MNQSNRSGQKLQGSAATAEPPLPPQEFVASLSGRHALAYCAVGAAYPELGRPIVDLDDASLPDAGKQELLARWAWQAEAQVRGLVRGGGGQLVPTRLFRRQGLRAFQRWVRLLWTADPEARGYRALAERAFGPVLQLFRELREGWSDLTWSLFGRRVTAIVAALAAQAVDYCKPRAPPPSPGDPAIWPYTPRAPPL